MSDAELLLQVVVDFRLGQVLKNEEANIIDEFFANRIANALEDLGDCGTNTLNFVSSVVLADGINSALNTDPLGGGFLELLDESLDFSGEDRGCPLVEVGESSREDLPTDRLGEILQHATEFGDADIDGRLEKADALSDENTNSAFERTELFATRTSRRVELILDVFVSEDSGVDEIESSINEALLESFGAVVVDGSTDLKFIGVIKFAAKAELDIATSMNAAGQSSGHIAEASPELQLAIVAVLETVELVLSLGLELTQLGGYLAALAEKIGEHVLLQEGDDVVVAATLQDFRILVSVVVLEEVEAVGDGLVFGEVVVLRFLGRGVDDEEPAEVGKLGFFVSKNEAGNVAAVIHAVGVGQDADGTLELRIGATGSSEPR